jgi:NitT/TauT family transport system ATP-binding protein
VSGFTVTTEGGRSVRSPKSHGQQGAIHGLRCRSAITGDLAGHSVNRSMSESSPGAAAGKTVGSASLASTASRPVVAELHQVTVRFTDERTEQSREVLQKVDLQIRDGEFVVLVGRSGCGKTTILNTFAGLLEPTSGQVNVLGVQPLEARRRVGYMFARDALLPWRSARQNVEYGLELRGLSRADRHRTSQRYLDLVGLRDAASRWPWQLSQGMRQRVAIARTLALEPDLLLMDEPFSALDADTRETLQQEFLRMWDENKRTVVFVTHDLTEAIFLADRIVLIADGEIIQDVRVPFPRPRVMDSLVTSVEFSKLWRSLRVSLGSATEHTAP